MIDAVIVNLINIAYGIGLYLISYISNVLFGMYYNVRVIGNDFDFHKLLNSLIKVLCIGLGTATLSLAITLVPIYSKYVGFNIPDEYTMVFNNLVIISIYLVSACQYISEAYQKLKLIIQNDKTKSLNDELKLEITHRDHQSFRDTNSIDKEKGGQKLYD